MQRNFACQLHQVEDLQDFVLTVLLAGFRDPLPKMRGNNSMKLKHRRQNTMNDGILIVGFILGIGVDDDSYSLGRKR